MDKWSSFERVMAVWTLALGTSALLTVFVGMGGWISENSANVASWVQAVGSIGAIAAGFGVASFQFAQVDKRERLKAGEFDRIQMRNRCLAFSYRMRIYSGISASIVNNSDHYEYLWYMWETDCDHLLEQLNAIPSAEYAAPETAHELGVVRVRLLAIVKAIKLGAEAKKQADLGQGQISQFAWYANALHQHAYDFATYVDWLVVRYAKIADEMSTEEERTRVAAHQVRMNNQFGVGNINPTDTGNPQTPQPPAASQ